MKNRFTLMARIRLFGSLMLVAAIHAVTLGQSSHSVEVTNNVYSPADITIQAGDTVVWTNQEGRHNVNGLQATFPDNPESFGNDLGQGWVFSHVFSLPGEYDYQCDPHVNWGMVGTVTVLETISTDTLTIAFTGMTPHAGQTGWILVSDEDEGEEILRSSISIEEAFSLQVPGIKNGNSYTIDIYADHNGNGYYDAPPVDHAWQLELKDVQGSETVQFSHNTNFKDIEWEHRAYLNLSGMTPHVGQEIYFALIESESGEIIDRRSEIVEETMTVELGELKPGKAYHVDFFSDHNSNGYYDAPPADHAWRLNITEAMGDHSLDFAHSTDFTDVMWQHRLRVRFSGMTPHVGQMFTLFVKESGTQAYLDTLELESISEEAFDLESYVVEPGTSYEVDFYSDHNGNGVYDAPPTDHAWRLETGVISGDMDLDFQHSTEFTDIFATTGIGDTHTGMAFLVYPNPATNLLQIESEQHIGSVALYDLRGAKVKEIPGAQQLSLSFSLEDIPSGMYFVEVRSSSGNKAVSQLIKR